MHYNIRDLPGLRKRISIITCVIIIYYLTIIISSYLSGLYQAIDWNNHAVTTTATIIDAHSVKTSICSNILALVRYNNYNLTVILAANICGNITQYIIQHYPVGQQFIIYYNRNQPSDARLTLMNTDGVVLSGIFLGVIPIVAIVPYLIIEITYQRSSTNNIAVRPISMDDIGF